MTQTISETPTLDEISRRERHGLGMRHAEQLAENIPTDAYIAATGVSILASITLYLSGHKLGAIFVGLWAPTIINLAVMARLIRPSER
jgi:hypothetical protein